jgi:sugar phosphate isomerase/epimerase
MSYTTRRNFLSATAALVTGSIIGTNKLFGAPSIIHSRPGIAGVRLGLITYSFRDMPAQDADSILQYILASGVKEVELMGDVAEVYAGKPKNPVDYSSIWPLMQKRNERKELTADEQKTLSEAEQQRDAYRKSVASWRSSASLSKFEEFAAMYKKAGVSIYAFKPDAFGKENTDAEIDFAMRAARTLGATHVTVEHPSDDAHTLKLGTMAAKNGIKVGYHGHEQQTPTFWDTAIKQSTGNAINLDLGHFVAAGNTDPLGFIREKHDHIVSMHTKDRTTPAHGRGNLPWGTGDTPIADALKLIRDNNYTFPATIELEYKVPTGSDPVKEVKKCVEYCKNVLG